MDCLINKRELIEYLNKVDGIIADGTVEAPTLYKQIISDIEQFPAAGQVTVNPIDPITFKDYKMCNDKETAIELLEFIKLSYEAQTDKAGVHKYIDALQIAIYTLKNQISMSKSVSAKAIFDKYCSYSSSCDECSKKVRRLCTKKDRISQKLIKIAKEFFKCENCSGNGNCLLKPEICRDKHNKPWFSPKGGKR